MTRKTILALLEQVDTTLPDNTEGAITPAVLRTMLRDVVDSFSPGYGACGIAAPLTLAALGTVPRVIPYTIELARTPEFEITMASGAIKRLAQGLPTTVNRISFYADVAAPSGSEVAFALYRNGAAIPGGTTVSGQGAGNVSLAAFSVGTTSPDGADYTYDVRAAKVSGAADDVVLTNARFIIEVIPTIGI